MNSPLEILRQGTVIPAMPLAMADDRSFDEQKQRALIRYYSACGAGGLAVGVHTTQFEIRDPAFNLFEQVLRVANDERQRLNAERRQPLALVAGICGQTAAAVEEAVTARQLGYDAGLLSLSALAGWSTDDMIAHCRSVAEIIPVFGFYLQPAVGGIELSYRFWREFAEIESVVAIKLAPFDRYATLDVVRAIVDAGRDDIALYTGNDDNIVVDLLTPFRINQSGQMIERRIVGGLLGHWAVWTRHAVRLFDRCREIADSASPIPADLLATAAEVTDCNAALFDAANQFRGCLPGIHEVLRREGLLDNRHCLDQTLDLSPGQSAELDRVYDAYPWISDRSFIANNPAISAMNKTETS